jgi:hypothetical protein
MSHLTRNHILQQVLLATATLGMAHQLGGRTMHDSAVVTDAERIAQAKSEVEVMLKAMEKYERKWLKAYGPTAPTKCEIGDAVIKIARRIGNPLALFMRLEQLLGETHEIQDKTLDLKLAEPPPSHLIDCGTHWEDSVLVTA